MDRRKSIRRGFSLIEAAIVLGVVGLVIGGIWVAASVVIENDRVNRASTATILMVGNARRLIGKDAGVMMEKLGQNAEHNLADMMIAAGAVPTDLVSNGHLKTPWDTEMRFYIGDTGGGVLPTPWLAVTFLGLPASSCRRLVVAISNHFHDRSELTRIYMQGTIAGDQAFFHSFPVSLSDPTLCYTEAADGTMFMFSFFFNPS